MFARGSIPWFIAHDLRVTWRTWFQRKPRKAGKRRRFVVPVPVVAGLLLLVAVGAIGVPVALSAQDTEFVATPIIAFIIDAVLILVFTLMLSQTLVAAVDAFYDRGDLDLLLSSPIPPTRILVMRAIAMALNPALLFWAMTTPFVLPMAVLGHPEVLAVYVVVGCLALLATAIGLAIAIGLFASIGPRRTRTIAQVLAAIVGAAFVIVAQIPNLMGVDDNTSIDTTWLAGIATGENFPTFALWPAQAMLGAPVQLLAILAVSLGGFAAIAAWVGRRFARDAAAAFGADTARRRTGRGDARFGASLRRAIMAKEWRMMIRDPGLISQVLLRMIYLVPLAIVILTDQSRSAGEDAVSLIGPIVAAGATLLAGQLSGSIAWIVISAEDAPQLLASAPVPVRGFWRAKLGVALIIPAVFLTPLLLVFAFFEPLAAAIALPTAAASAWSAAMINLWLQKPTKRSEFRRAWSSTFGANMLELITSMSLAAFAGMMVAGVVYAWIALGVAVIVVALARRSEAAILERLTASA